MWIASILLALVFLSEGAAKFRESRLWVQMFDQIGPGQWFRYFTGVVEVSGAFVTGIGRPTLGVVLLLSALVAIGIDAKRRRRISLG